jgi:beta-glucanase (GH16 family)
MSDEFDGEELDLNKWNRGLYWWKGRQPALFSDENVTVSDGKLHLTMRKEKVPEQFEKWGYRDYTSAALHTKVRSSYGYYEAKARPMNSGGSSSFWFQVEDVPGWLTEIDVFEIGGKAKVFEHKYNMNVHVFRTPKETPNSCRRSIRWFSLPSSTSQVGNMHVPPSRSIIDRANRRQNTTLRRNP